MKYLVHFSQSDALAESVIERPNSEYHVFEEPWTLESDEYVQITYEGLRSGPNGDDLAWVDNSGLWWVASARKTHDGKTINMNNPGYYINLGPFSDIVIVAQT